MFIALSIAASSSWACTRTGPPDHAMLAEYSVLVVEVTGIHLTAYESRRLAERGAASRDEPSSIFGQYTGIGGFTPEFKADVLVDRVVSGMSEPARTLTLSDCALPIPALKEKGIAVVPREGVEARTKVVWASEGELYASWARRLGVSETGSGE
ncbi:hypothetical protein ACQQ2N_08300 [Dokdonella sp. MW10]|uniref:hypothetical protein n=1 Tax=Dokdonella sp. MW10 TaxID=2992926 RepID=UPI003F7E44C6